MTIHKIMLCFSLNFRAFFNPKLSGGFPRKQLAGMDLETTFFLFTKHTKMELYHLRVVILLIQFVAALKWSVETLIPERKSGCCCLIRSNEKTYEKLVLGCESIRRFLGNLHCS